MSLVWVSWCVNDLALLASNFIMLSDFYYVLIKTNVYFPQWGTTDKGLHKEQRV